MKPIKNVFPASEGSENTQWTEVKALKCWADENEAKLEVWGQDSSYVPILNCFHFIPKTHRSSRDCSAS